MSWAILISTTEYYLQIAIGNKLSSLFLFFVIAFYTFQRLVLKPPCRATYHYFNFALLIYFTVIMGYFLFRDAQWLRERLKERRKEKSLSRE